MTAFDRIAAFLADPATHGGTRTRRIDTHTAVVVLAGDRAWKLRRPVDYGWLDYGSRERRHLCAEREIQLNAQAAPGLYLGLGGITGCGSDMTLLPPDEATGKADEEAEPLVVMRRFDQDDLFDRMSAEGRLTPALMRQTGRAVADMHKRARRDSPPREGAGRLPAFAGRETNELIDLGDVLCAGAVTRFSALIQERARAVVNQAASRPARRCHGDLHLRNFVLWRGRPAPFDCIDFSDTFTHVDPLYDLAFLLMDLDHRKQAHLSTEVFNAWAERMAAEPDAEPETAYGGLALVPFFKACRAGIRAKVSAMALAGARPMASPDDLAEARAYLDLGIRYLETPPTPRLIAVGGLSGSGKSTLAWALAARLDAVILRSDAIRKGLWGVDLDQRLPPEAYTPDASVQVYGEMRSRAHLALTGGAPVILDAAHFQPEERKAASRLAAEAGVPFHGFWLDAPLAQLSTRVEARHGDASDAGAAALHSQSTYDLGFIDWHHLDASDDPARVAELAFAGLAQ